MVTQAFEPATNKISILYFISELDIPLTNAHIAHFFAENDLINYFELQHYLAELISAGHLNHLEIGGNDFYTIASKGTEVLSLFNRRIPKSLKDKITYYATENRVRLREESQLTADYRKIADKEYEVTCKVIENQMMLLELKLNVATSKQAKTICNNWKNSALDVYRAIIDQLT